MSVILAFASRLTNGGRAGVRGGSRRALALFVSLLAIGLLGAFGGASAFAYTELQYVSTLTSIASPEGLAVDESTGDVYVLDTATSSIHKFNAAGEPQEFTSTHEYAITGVEVGGSSENEIAVDNSNKATKGDIYVADSPGHKVIIYGPGGSKLEELTGGSAPWAEVCGIAVDPSGRLYVGIYGGINRYVSATNANPLTDADYSASVSTSNTCNIAVDSAGNAYAVEWPAGPITKYTESQFGAGGAGVQVSSGQQTMAVDQSNNDLYADSSNSLKRYDDEGNLLEEAQGSGAAAFSGSGAIAVDGASHTIYVADSGHGRVEIWKQVPPPTAPPSVDQQSTAHVSSTSAAVFAQIDPHYLPTTYYVQYGTADCASSQCAEYPAAPGAQLQGAPAEQDLGGIATLVGLQPSTLYHYRVAAVNAKGTTFGPDDTFTTASTEGLSFELPDNRAYELVSPIEKYGYGTASNVVQSSASGDAVFFASAGGFAGDEASKEGNAYVATRDGADWSTLAAQPQFETGGTQYAPGSEVLALTDDLSKEIVRVIEPALTPDAPPGVANLYIRDNRTGKYTLITTATPHPVPAGYAPGFADATPDFSYVLFQAMGNLIPGSGAPEGVVNLYEWHNGQLSLIHITPPSGGSGYTVAGDGSGDTVGGYEGGLPGGRTQHSISRDGSRVIFTVNAVEPNRGLGQLYMKDGNAVVHISASQRSTPATAPEEVDFETASWDGSKVLFVSEDQLTDDANPVGVDLYLYDLSSGKLTDLTAGVSSPESDRRTETLAASEDLSYIYFAYGGQLYLWHEGQLLRIAGATGVGPLGNAQHNGYSLPNDGDMTPDGRTFAFATDEVYVFHADTDQLSCASCASSGAPSGGAKLADNASGNNGSFQESKLGLGGYRYKPRSVTAEGDVYFSSPDALVPADRNGRYDVYQWHDGSVHLISTGQSDKNSVLGDVSLDGRNVFFSTYQGLVAGDVDGQMDLYDARVNGGFPEGSRSAPPPCAGDVCRPPASSPLMFGAPQSMAFSSDGNVVPSASAPHAKAVKPKKKKKAAVKKRRKRAKHAKKRKAKKSLSRRTKR